MSLLVQPFANVAQVLSIVNSHIISVFSLWVIDAMVPHLTVQQHQFHSSAIILPLEHKPLFKIQWERHFSPRKHRTPASIPKHDWRSPSSYPWSSEIIFTYSLHPCCQPIEGQKACSAKYIDDKQSFKALTS